MNIGGDDVVARSAWDVLPLAKLLREVECRGLVIRRAFLRNAAGDSGDKIFVAADALDVLCLALGGELHAGGLEWERRTLVCELAGR